MLRRINYPVVRFRDEMDRLFGNVFEGSPADRSWGVGGRRPFPALNLWEKGDTLYAEAEAPGLEMDDLEVFVQDNELTVKGERKDAEGEEVTYHHRERGIGKFVRMVRLPVEIDAEKVAATLRNGVLTITLPKVQAVLPKKIAVEAT